MAHEISTVRGRAEAAYALQPAWHGLGKVLDFVPDSEAMIEAAGLDWTVRMEPVTSRTGVDGCDARMTIRDDTNQMLGMVTNKYNIIQNREAFKFLDGLWQDGVMKYESAMALRGGRVIAVVARMPSRIDEIAAGDTCARYVLFQTSHDGKMGLRAIPTSVRVVCMNTLRLAIQGIDAISHMGDMQMKLDAMRSYVSQFDERFTLFSDGAKRLAEIKVERPEAQKYLTQLFPKPEENAGKITLNNWRDKITNIRGNFDNERQSMPSIKGTWWALFNSVTELVDHGKVKKTAKQRENRFNSVIDGPGHILKTKAMSLALEMSGAETKTVVTV